MPIYEYRCTTCDHTLEIIQKLSDDPLTDCPACGAVALKKLISAVGFRLKGSGWYQTDFKGGDKKTTPRSDALAPTESTSTPSASTSDSTTACATCPAAASTTKD